MAKKNAKARTTAKTKAIIRSLRPLGFAPIHEAVNHVNAYVEGNVHTNGLENVWSLMKRNLASTQVAVEPFHLNAYFDQQMFRFNNRATKDNPLDDADRFMLAVSQISGNRLTHAETDWQRGGNGILRITNRRTEKRL
jgi:hypothetical protein